MARYRDYHAYFRSLASELQTQADRVRHLIGDSHWLSDGHHKEYLLTSLLERHLPGNTLIGRGFVVDPVEPGRQSKEQDIVIVDTTTEGPLFYQSGLLITMPSAVLATVSVKSTLRRDTIKESLGNQLSVRHVLAHAGVAPGQHWSGAYFFQNNNPVQATPLRVYDYYEDAVKADVLLSSDPGLLSPDLLCSASGLFFTVRASQAPSSAVRVLGYSCGSLSTAVFVALLIDHISLVRSRRPSELPSLIEHADIAPLSVAERRVCIPPPER